MSHANVTSLTVICASYPHSSLFLLWFTQISLTNVLVLSISINIFWKVGI